MMDADSALQLYDRHIYIGTPGKAEDILVQDNQNSGILTKNPSKLSINSVGEFAKSVKWATGRKASLPSIRMKNR